MGVEGVGSSAGAATEFNVHLQKTQLKGQEQITAKLIESTKASSPARHAHSTGKSVNVEA